MSLPFVYVIILNWNRAAETVACIESLHKLTYPNFRILAIDNASRDGSSQILAQHFPRLEQMVLPKNLGFAGGFNVGLRHALDADAEFAFILNNDTIVAPNMLEVLVAAASPAAVGIVAPAIFYATEPNRVWSTGGGHNPVTLEITGDNGRRETLVDVTERQFLSGCAMLIKRAVLEHVGLFDERFFVYYEDSDYCLRARQAGYQLKVVPHARIWHQVSTSSDGSNSPLERYWMGRSSVLFFRKHARGWQWCVIIPWRIGSALKTTLRLVRAGRWSAARAYLQGVREGIFAK